MEEAYVDIDLDAGRAEALVGAEDEQLREVFARTLGKGLRVKDTDRGTAHLNAYDARTI